MTTDHPMQPSDDQIRKWRIAAPNGCDGGVTRDHWIARTAYAAGADAQLDRAAEWLRSAALADRLRAAMRPKPPSLAEQAWEELSTLRTDAQRCGLGFSAGAMRRALERLAELEGQQDG